MLVVVQHPLSLRVLKASMYVMIMIMISISSMVMLYTTCLVITRFTFSISVFYRICCTDVATPVTLPTTIITSVTSSSSPPSPILLPSPSQPPPPPTTTLTLTPHNRNATVTHQLPQTATP